MYFLIMGWRTASLELRKQPLQSAGSSLGFCIIDRINRPGFGVRSERDGWINNASGDWFGVSFWTEEGIFTCDTELTVRP